MYFILDHGGERIDDVNRDPARTLRCFTAAIASAEAAIASRSSPGASVRIGQKALSALIWALSAGESRVAGEMLSRVRVHLGATHLSRWKAEVLSLGSRLLGPSFPRGVARRLWPHYAIPDGRVPLAPADPSAAN
jgi:hypothetical protein